MVAEVCFFFCYSLERGVQWFSEVVFHVFWFLFKWFGQYSSIIYSGSNTDS